MGRTFSPQKIQQKIIWVLSNFPKTTSEHWRRTPGTQKGSPFSSKWGRQNIKHKNTDKRVRDGDPSWGRSREGGAVVSKQQENLSLVGLWGVLESQRATQPGGKHTHTHTHTHTHYTSNCNSQRRCSPDAHICYQWQGLDREAWVACLG